VNLVNDKSILEISNQLNKLDIDTNTGFSFPYFIVSYNG